MENNPEALEDVKQTVAMDQYGNPITKQPLAGGGTVVERDVEAQTSGPATVTVTTQPSTARQTVNPTVTTTTSKQAQTQTTSSGWWDVFASRSQGRYFFPLHAAIVFFSFLVLVSASIIETTFVGAAGAAGATGTLFVQYAIVIAQFAFAVSLGACVMDRLGLLSNAYLRVALSVFQLFFWIPGLVLLTFFGSFLSPVTNANGFFGAWFALLAAAAIFSHESQRANPERRNFTSPVTALLLLFFIGLMEMGSAIQLYAGNYQNLPNNGFTAQNGPPFNYTVFGISWGAITAFLALVLLLFYEAFSPVLTLAFSVFVWLWVVVGALVLTFADPWRLALGNGYYSCLFAVVASMGLLISLRKADQNPGQNTTTYRNTTGNANANATTTTTNANRRDDNYYSTSFYSFVRGGAIASLGVLVAACLTCRNHGGCNGNIERYQIAAGAVGLGLGLIFIILELVGFGHVPSIVKIIFSFIWMAWWIAAFIILTWFGSFQGPVNNTEYANGFFFTWIALVFACLAFAAAIKEQSTVSETQNLLVPKLGFLFVIVIGSLIELGSAINAYYVVGNNNLTRYALALGCVSIFLILVLLVTLTCLRTNNTAHDSTYHFVLYILLIWWAVGALVLTYKPLWTAATDNGYFSLFFTLTTVLLALSGIWRHEDEANYYDTQQQTTTTTTNNNYQAFGNEPNTTTYAAATTSGPAGGEATATTSSAKY